ncbi:hypothetical protein [Paenibacillus zanthoxyli]|uniref:hypothetical protein n=1 Tax=Paenibacillus zanthoxyli TaxID=369399 RepID=UPI0004B9F875|nr:hypothetical protein [Paenibacillus zanthoxyli]
MLLDERNSYSKTGPDAMFMRMKEDYMRNGQLKPDTMCRSGRRISLLLGSSVHQRPTNTRS